MNLSGHFKGERNLVWGHFRLVQPEGWPRSQLLLSRSRRRQRLDQGCVGADTTSRSVFRIAKAKLYYGIMSSKLLSGGLLSVHISSTVGILKEI